MAYLICNSVPETHLCLVKNLIKHITRNPLIVLEKKIKLTKCDPLQWTKQFQERETRHLTQFFLIAVTLSILKSHRSASFVIVWNYRRSNEINPVTPVRLFHDESLCTECYIVFFFQDNELLSKLLNPPEVGFLMQNSGAIIYQTEPAIFFYDCIKSTLRVVSFISFDFYLKICGETIVLQSPLFYSIKFHFWFSKWSLLHTSTTQLPSFS